jgi:hypothetical protein
MPELLWYHGDEYDYETQARSQGYTLGRMGDEFDKRYQEIHHDYIFECMTYTQYINKLKQLEKDLNRYAESEINRTIRKEFPSSCYLDQGITQGIV